MKTAELITRLSALPDQNEELNLVIWSRDNGDIKLIRIESENDLASKVLKLLGTKPRKKKA